MAKKIIILQKQDFTNYFEVSFVFWLAVPVSQQPFRVNSLATSVYSGATTAEIQAIQAGQIYEYVGRASYPVGTVNTTIAADLVGKYNNAQTDLSNQTLFQFYGTYWDGTAWTIQGG